MTSEDIAKVRSLCIKMGMLVALSILLVVGGMLSMNDTLRVFGFLLLIVITNAFIAGLIITILTTINTYSSDSYSNPKPDFKEARRDYDRIAEIYTPQDRKP